MGKLDDIGKGVEDLRNRSTAAERGIISIYDFNGARRTGRPGVMSLEVGPEIATFQKMRELNS
jgi:hypothetical protein